MSGCHVPTETIEERIEKLEEKINQLNYSNCKRIEENTLISRRLTQIERFQNNDNGNNKYCFECGRKHED